MGEFLDGRGRLAHAASLGRWLMDRRPADARAIADGAGAVLAERNALADQVQRVRALHTPEDRLGRWTCGHCLGSDEEPLPYPCPTIAALDAEPGA